MGTPIEVNSSYIKADLKISIGGVIPHPLAGFGGGAKIVLPGVCGIRTLEANHSAGMKGVGGGIGVMTNIREDIEDIADKVGLDFSINAILTESGKIAALTSGHFRDAHRKAMELGKKNYSTKYTKNNQICFFNLFPEDSELNQSTKGFNFLAQRPRNLLERKGSVVLMSSSYEGRGYHSLIGETGAKLYKRIGDDIIWQAFARKKRVYFFSPNISELDLYHFYPNSVKLYHEWNNLIKELSIVHGDTPKAALFPCSIQMPEI
jgi:nickel-dependent lactate racemase